jgi:uncharacterized protein (TIGR02118 family)
MIKLVTFQKRHVSLTRPEFEERWRSIHGPIAAVFPGLRGYILGFSLDEGEPSADGIAQLWFDTREACQASYASDTGRKGSSDASAWLVRREHLLASETWLRCIAPLNATPYKVVLCTKRRDAERREEFLDWLTALLTEQDFAGAIGADQARLSVDECGLLLNSAVEGNLGLRQGEAPYDAIIEAWFTHLPAAENGRQRLHAWAADNLERRLSRSEDALLTEHVVVMPPPPAYGTTEGMI